MEVTMETYEARVLNFWTRSDGVACCLLGFGVDGQPVEIEYILKTPEEAARLMLGPITKEHVKVTFDGKNVKLA
jgi:hypothetical protein